MEQPIVTPSHTVPNTTPVAPVSPAPHPRKKGLFFGGILVLLILLGVGAYTWLSLSAKPKVYHIGLLNGLGIFAQTVDGFKQKMTALGYTEGKNITYETYQTNFEPEKEKEIFKKFVDEKVDLIVSSPTEVSQEAKAATVGTNIPVVFVNAFTENSNLVDSVTHPGGNATGVRYPGPEIIVRSLQILHEMAPEAKRIYTPYDPTYPASKPVMDALRPAAESLHLTLVEVPVTSLDALYADLAKRTSLKDIGVDGIITIPNTITPSPPGVAAIEKFALAHKLPYQTAISPDDPIGLFFIAPDPVEAGGEAATLADKILHGTSAGTLPVVSEEGYLYINYKVAQSLGLTVSESLLTSAKQVIH